MTKRTPRVFLDTSAIIAAVLSEKGGARKLFRLGEAGVIQLLAGPNMLRECEAVVRRKAPNSLPILAYLLELGRVEIVNSQVIDFIEAARKIVTYRPDGTILAEAMGTRPDWFITHDKTHFLNAEPDRALGFQIGTPGDCLQALAESFKRS